MPAFSHRSIRQVPQVLQQRFRLAWLSRLVDQELLRTRPVSGIHDPGEGLLPRRGRLRVSERFELGHDDIFEVAAFTPHPSPPPPPR